MDFIKRLSAAAEISGKLDILETIISSLESYEGNIKRLEELAKRLPVRAPQPAAPPMADAWAEERLKLLARFANAFDRAKEIEQEWQRIQQDEHDFQYAFKCSPTEDTQSTYLYKKGIADGVKWCVNLFS